MSPPAPATARLAIVVVTHDSSQILARWADALDSLGLAGAIESCAVDSGSSPAELARTEALCAARGIRLVSRPNVGFGRACNAGAEATSAPVLLFTNPDSLFESLPQRALSADGLGGAILGGFGLCDGDRRPLGFAESPDFAQQARDLAFGRRSHPFARTVADPAWVSGSALVVERADFERVGGFADDFFLYFEDADLCARHRRAGGRVELDPELLVRHLGGQSSDAADPSALARALDGVNRLSGRIYVQRHGRRWQRAVLYALLVTVYAPRRAAVSLLRRRARPAEVLDHVACVLATRRALARLGAARAPRTDH